MNYQILFEKSELTGDVYLPFSKSISNRLLIIHALTGGNFRIQNLSESDDTRHMEEAFRNRTDEVNIGHAGTAMRFLTAYFAATQQKKIITGSERMKNRPIAALVDALNSVGASVAYAEKDGYPPLITSGKPLQGNAIHVKGSISSQYITALLLIAPVLPQGLTIHISDTLISSSYVKMTLEMMHYFGIQSSWEGNTISIAPQQYSPRDYTVEADWSGASYWYQLALLAPSSRIILHGLFEKSSQGDSAIAGMFSRIGVESAFEDGKLYLRKKEVVCSFFEADFINTPDMVQTFVVALCLKGIPFRISGAQTLRIKETDRIAALQNEMSKLGFPLEELSPGVLAWNGEKTSPQRNICIDTYDDHRMALAFAPAALYYPGLIINNAEVVTKSYPQYWEQLRELGLELQEA